MSETASDLSVPCPICGEPMIQSDEDRGEAYICAEHGAWLPEDSLQLLVAAARRRGRKGSDRKIRSARRQGVMSGLFLGIWALMDDGPDSGRRRRRRTIINPDSGSDTSNADIVPEGSRPCPACSEFMVPRASESIMIDACEAHGVWLDGSELEQMLNRARNRSRLSTRRRQTAARRRGAVDANIWGFFALLG